MVTEQSRPDTVINKIESAVIRWNNILELPNGDNNGYNKIEISASLSNDGDNGTLGYASISSIQFLETRIFGNVLPASGQFVLNTYYTVSDASNFTWGKAYIGCRYSLVFTICK